MSLAGAVLAWRGAKRINTTAGVAQVVAGRLIDTLDGTVARQTGQTSNFGAIVDAGLDKTTTAKLLYENVASRHCSKRSTRINSCF